ncbi:6-phosphogluconolactonase [Bienertia sinuspersici]
MTGAFADKWKIDQSSAPEEVDTTKPLSLLYDRISRREWTEDIIRRCKTTLTKTDLIDAVYASMFLYKCNSSLMQRFCEFWCPQRIPFSLEMVKLLLACGTFESLAGSPYMAHSTMRLSLLLLS